MPLATNAKYPRFPIRGAVRSTQLEDLRTNVKNDINTLEQQIADASIGTTNAETTAARPYHTDLKSRLDTIGSGQANFIDGFEVTAQGSPNMTVQVATGEGTIDGIEVEKTSTTNTGTIVAADPGETRFWVVYIDSTNTIGLADGGSGTDPVYPNITQTQKALALITVDDTTTSITSSEITDCRSWGAYYFHDGAFKYKWKAQDAIDDLDTTIGGEIKLIGDFYEELDISGNNNVVIQGHEANIYRISDTNACVKSVNTVSNETTGNKIYGLKCFGNSKAGSLPLYEFDYTDEFVLQDCTGDGNSSSSATGKDIEVNNCDDFLVKSKKMDSFDFPSSIGIFDYKSYNYTGIGTGSYPLSSVQSITNATVSTSYVELCYFYSLYQGDASVVFNHSETGSGTGFARIYVNGSAVGTERSTTSSTTTTYTETISISIGDRVSVYGKVSGGSLGSNVSNLHALGDRQVGCVGVVNA